MADFGDIVDAVSYGMKFLVLVEGWSGYRQVILEGEKEEDRKVLFEVALHNPDKCATCSIRVGQIDQKLNEKNIPHVWIPYNMTLRVVIDAPQSRIFRKEQIKIYLSGILDVKFI